MKTKRERARHCATICYAEDITLEQIKSLIPSDVTGFISPLHDDEGKKPHYHVLVTFSNAHSLHTFDDIFSLVHGRGLEVVRNVKQYAQYLCHLNALDKKQYSIDDVTSLGGLVYSDFLQSSSSAHLRNLLSFIEEENIMSFSEFIYKLSLMSDDSAFDYATSHHAFFRDYIKSRTWTMKERIYLDDLIEKNELRKVDRFETEQLKF